MPKNETIYHIVFILYKQKGGIHKKTDTYHSVSNTTHQYNTLFFKYKSYITMVIYLYMGANLSFFFKNSQ